MSDHKEYETVLYNRFWKYRNTRFKDNADYFDTEYYQTKGSPPVFKKDFKEKKFEENNILMQPGIQESKKEKIIKQIQKRHQWFRSMSSSQALTLSVFGNLKEYGKLNCLSHLKGDNGRPLFMMDSNQKNNCKLEFNVGYLGESNRNPTQVDVFFKGDYRVAVECKLREEEIGSCGSSESGKDQECDGKYRKQNGRSERCVKTENGRKYWEYIPQLFKWQSVIDHDPCPLQDTYQLVRTVLAACITPDGKVDPDNGHTVLVYDEHNPVFQERGKGREAYQKVRDALKDKSLLQSCSWQEIMWSMKADTDLDWLTDELEEKYGFLSG